jgi:hypothetical protein
MMLLIGSWSAPQYLDASDTDHLIVRLAGATARGVSFSTTMKWKGAARLVKVSVHRSNDLHDRVLAPAPKPMPYDLAA